MHIQLTGYYGINCYRYCSCKNIVTIYLGAGFGLFIIQDGKVYRGESQLIEMQGDKAKDGNTMLEMIVGFIGNLTATFLAYCLGMKLERKE